MKTILPLVPGIALTPPEERFVTAMRAHRRQTGRAPHWDDVLRGLEKLGYRDRTKRRRR